MDAERLTELLDCGFYTGVPDSQLKPLCDFLYCRYGTDPRRHAVAANEGAAAALAMYGHFEVVDASIRREQLF